MDPDGTTRSDTIVSPVANPWLSGTLRNTLNFLAPGTVEFRRTVAVAWCSYSHVTQLRSWLPDDVGGICWLSLDNPGQSPRIPVFSGTTRLPEAYDRCGQHAYEPATALWQFRRANKLATVMWQNTKGILLDNVLQVEQSALDGLAGLELDVAAAASPELRSALINAYTRRVYDDAVSRWARLEARFWQQFGMGF